jgi:hypothetical protein
MIKYLALTLLALPLGFAHATESGTVPTTQLEADFSISPSDDGTMAVGTVDLFAVSAENGVLHEDALDFSADETLTFTVNGTTVAYDRTKGEADMPFAPNSTYTVNYTRANGEKYTSTVTMPDVVKFATPAQDQVFQKADAVTVSWANVQADLMLVEYSPPCANAQGDPAVNDAFTQAIFPANYAANCTGASSVNFQMVNAIAGSGFGTFSAMSAAQINWSYGASMQKAIHMDRHMLNKKFAELHRAHKTHAKIRL